jgi:hypothetical protein
MPKICVKAPEIVMSGDININTAMTVVTKAKLESVTVGGDCDCGDIPPPSHITDYVILIDGSDSFNNKCKVGNVTEEGTAFKFTQQWADKLIKNLADHKKADDTTVTLIQFSGIKQLEKNYKPGSGGRAGNGDDHYEINIEPTRLTSAVNVDELIKDKNQKIESLDGNGQLFLCLQDCAMSSFKAKLAATSPNATRTRSLIIVTDEEWDLNHLQRASEFGGGLATVDSVCKAVRAAYQAVHMVVVRPNEDRDMNVDTIKKLATHDYKVYTESFQSHMNEAGKQLMANLGYPSKNFL